MLQGALHSGAAQRRSVFELFGRRLPDGRRYGVVAGVGRALEALADFRFTEEELTFLADRRVVDEATLDYRRGYRFTGSAWGYAEGEIYFPGSPLLIVEASFAEAVSYTHLDVYKRQEYAYTMLKRAFRNRTVEKTYHALVQGLPDPVVGTIDAPIGRHPAYDYKYAVMKSGKRAITHYEVIEAFGAASLVQVQLETGRTHQIRVHFAAVRHPCCGDPVYGGDPVLAKRLGLDRQWLHATGLGFEHPLSLIHI